MDEQLQARIEEAKAAGYSDEDIQKYLQTKDQPLPQEKPIDRTEEYKGMATAIAPDALITGAEIGAAGYAGKKLLNALSQKWSDEQLDHFQISHPILGLLTIRELAYFTIYHNGHHLETIRKYYLK